MYPFTFGIYAGSAVGAEEGLLSGSPDRSEAILAALDALQPTDKLFVVRAYTGYAGEDKLETATPENFVQYTNLNRKLDLVLYYRATDDSINSWMDFIREIVQQFGPYLATLQITEEANSTGPGGDGVAPNVRVALVSGVLAAKTEIQRLGLSVDVGFSATINFNPADDFWRAIGQLGGQPFVEALDYVALDFFPDVFALLPPNVQLSNAVRGVLQQFRQVNMPQAGIPITVPMHIGENGWPTSPTRSYSQQAATLETIIRTIHQHRETFNIRRYELFSLRDVNSNEHNIFYQFGLLRDDYTPKPAFDVFRQLITELSV